MATRRHRGQVAGAELKCCSPSPTCAAAPAESRMRHRLTAIALPESSDVVNRRVPELMKLEHECAELRCAPARSIVGEVRCSPAMTRQSTIDRAAPRDVEQGASDPELTDTR